MGCAGCGGVARRPGSHIGRLVSSQVPGVAASGPYGLTANSEQNIKLLSRPVNSSIQTNTIHYPLTSTL